MDLIEQENMLPLYFAAPVSWYAACIDREVLKIADEKMFSRQTLRNRIVYGTFQGKKNFSIPLSHSSFSGKYRDIQINYSENWQNQLINALQTSYGKSPFFEFYGYRFENLIRKNFQYLWDLNMAMLDETLNCLRLKISVLPVLADRIADAEASALPAYYQVFNEKLPFIPDLSILDLIYNEGPDALEILVSGNKLRAV